ncbi:hypothetical protein COX24_03705 [bacterium (Candidatus Gribaldobacteria) CG23_combo_of_CG06-09_8_20_14_all_37_87_8]|uniref:HD/PDEase domain-containing protein n=2 Tax=Candidatus Gribaldobacteria TaxID=2798536 RepID=A0A2G9ZE09_9BACT|nr:MAG: hypothetical protein AUJ25_00560 [Parcubacteria group bacterium CG1_02_37_13]PIP31423.1 MAG: hypothetical protein COX24_03705 [bacterium (Candidatus Gribaldobacteria) CG23_combo_of_CG06-09_8_20_14_all_37_87_8]PIR90501.1 MAG: hypothetical protein COU05_01665 [bacterium (Candidatus Gribaldobacteria) CG10_big_fil_rev_8_21_14_0_10_37_21]
MKIKPPAIENIIEEAIKMLVHCVEENCRNDKPLILHSLRVGFVAMGLNFPRDVVVAGILHDLVEDTNCDFETIKRYFGHEVESLVKTLTQEHIEDYKKRWQVLLEKIKKKGKHAMIIKIIDANDNLTYIPLIKSKKSIKETLWKHHFLSEELRPFLSRNQTFRDYQNHLQSTEAKLENF